jgi:DNA mismatch endonuclease, patch repair protein
MSRVRNRDTEPERAVRRIIHGMGFRFRLHRRDLPGKPDLVFPSRKKVVFVHGCFWHGHSCARGTLPSTNQHFWQNKLLRNQMRDEASQLALAELGWNTLVIWECEIRRDVDLSRRIKNFLNDKLIDELLEHGEPPHAGT